MFIADIRSRLV